MDGTGVQITEFLLKRLKQCAIESSAYQLALFNFPDELRIRIQELKEKYRHSDSVRQTVEKQFQALDSLLELVSKALDQEEVRRLLEQYDPNAPIN